jgi:NAD(P)-dependent dehydrogenase (short-subunit alcohol dehydrogenase family)
VGENRKLLGKVAMVFGGSRGIGAAIVQRLAEDGADVALTYVSAANKAAEAVAAVEATGRRGLAIKADSADAVAIQEAVAQVVGRFGRFDIVVVNAGFCAWVLSKMSALRILIGCWTSTCVACSWPSRRPRGYSPTVDV